PLKVLPHCGAGALFAVPLAEMVLQLYFFGCAELSNPLIVTVRSDSVPGQDVSSVRGLLEVSGIGGGSRIGTSNGVLKVLCPLNVAVRVCLNDRGTTSQPRLWASGLWLAGQDRASVRGRPDKVQRCGFRVSRVGVLTLRL